MKRLALVILVVLCCGLPVAAQDVATGDSAVAALPADTLQQDTLTAEGKGAKHKKRSWLGGWFQGLSVGVDVVSPIQYLQGDYGGAEASLRLNLKNTFFPVVEAGHGRCDVTDDNTNINYKTAAPFLRVGLDYNVLRDKWQDNKLFVGARYGVSMYDFDISGPELVDPIWGGSEPFAYNGISTTTQWIELLAGVQVKIWRNFHMGWSVRYKRKIASTKNDYAEPYYVPGFGTTMSETAWGFNYSLIFDLNWGKKKMP